MELHTLGWINLGVTIFPLCWVQPVTSPLNAPPQKNLENISALKFVKACAACCNVFVCDIVPLISDTWGNLVLHNYLVTWHHNTEWEIFSVEDWQNTWEVTVYLVGVIQWTEEKLGIKLREQKSFSNLAWFLSSWWLGFFQAFPPTFLHHLVIPFLVNRFFKFVNTHQFYIYLYWLMSEKAAMGFFCPTQAKREWGSSFFPSACSPRTATTVSPVTWDSITCLSKLIPARHWSKSVDLDSIQQMWLWFHSQASAITMLHPGKLYWVRFWLAVLRQHDKL